MNVVYISIGNSDDKLTQAEWADFYQRTADLIEAYTHLVHGVWMSAATSQYQNACWAVVPFPKPIIEFKAELSRLGKIFAQDSIAWAECPETEFLS